MQPLVFSALREYITTARVSNKRHTMAAAIVYRREIIAIAGNDLSKSHPLQSRFARVPGETIYLHAEISAIVKALRRVSSTDLRRSKLYVARLLANGSYGTAKPCVGCQRAIDAFEIKEVYFT